MYNDVYNYTYIYIYLYMYIYQLHMGETYPIYLPINTQIPSGPTGFAPSIKVAILLEQRHGIFCAELPLDLAPGGCGCFCIEGAGLVVPGAAREIREVQKKGPASFRVLDDPVVYGLKNHWIRFFLVLIRLGSGCVCGSNGQVINWWSLRVGAIWVVQKCQSPRKDNWVTHLSIPEAQLTPKIKCHTMTVDMRIKNVYSCVTLQFSSISMSLPIFGFHLRFHGFSWSSQDH